MYSNAGLWLRRCRAQLATDVEYPLQHRETGEHRHSVDGRREKFEVAQSRANCAGLYASVETLGPIRVGDPVYLV